MAIGVTIRGFLCRAELQIQDLAAGTRIKGSVDMESNPPIGARQVRASVIDGPAARDNLRRAAVNRGVAAVLLLIVAIFVARPAAADYDPVSSPHLLGEWGGLRTHLSELGLLFDFGYVTESAHNFTG